MARPSSSSSSYVELLDPFNTGIETNIQSIQTLEHSYNRFEEVYEESVTNGHDHSSKTLQQFRSEIYSKVNFSVEVANYIDSIFKSILPPLTLDYASGRVGLYEIEISKSENLKLSKFQKKIVLARNKIVDLTIKLYHLRRRVNKSYENMVRNRFYNITGEVPDDLTVNEILSLRTAAVLSTSSSSSTNLAAPDDQEEEMTFMKKMMKERHELMMKIEKGMEDLEGILFGIYVMVQCQIRILNADEIGGGDYDGKSNKEHVSVHRSVETLVEKEEEKKARWFKLKIILIIIISSSILFFLVFSFLFA